MRSRAEPPAGGAVYACYAGVGHCVTALVYLLLPFLRAGRHAEGLAERMGHVPAEARGLNRPLWIHAASMGEVLAAAPLVRAIRQHDPAVPIVVSTTSLSGRATAGERLHADAVFLLPVDTPFFVRRALAGVAPRALVLVETEIWPTLIRAVARRGIPCVVVSGRLSEGAAARYERARGFFRRVLSQVSLVGAQSDGDAERFRDIGAPVERVVVLGNLKLSRAAAPPVRHAVRLRLPADRVVLVAASTHAPEEVLALDACARLWRDAPSTLLVLAPRRPERFDEVAEMVRRRGLRSVRRTAMAPSLEPSVQVLLLDTLGELTDVLPVARAVYVGGTMSSIGGHNVLEPGIYGRPVSFGSETRNVEAAATELLREGAAVRVGDASALADFWQRAVDDASWATAMGEAGRRVVERHSAAAQRTLQALLPYLA